MKLFQSSASEELYRIFIQGRGGEFLEKTETDTQEEFVESIAFFIRQGLEIVADSEEGYPCDGAPGTLFTIIFENPNAVRRLWNRMTVKKRFKQVKQFLRWELPDR